MIGYILTDGQVRGIEGATRILFFGICVLMGLLVYVSWLFYKEVKKR